MQMTGQLSIGDGPHCKQASPTFSDLIIYKRGLRANSDMSLSLFHGDERIFFAKNPNHANLSIRSLAG